VIDELSLAMTAGEAVGVIGPNGAGKTTMLNLVIGRLRPDAGVIRFDGLDVTGTAPHARCRAGIALTHQIPHPFEAMTVFENTLVGAIYGRGRRERDVYGACVGILHTTGLGDRSNRLAGTLTLLERKRLELARALATEPRLLLLDEIAGGLTEAEIQELLPVIAAIRDGGVAILWIEHIVHALRSIVDRLVAIDFGRFIVDGPVDAVMAHPDVQKVYLGIDVE
jgi:branched-chain amino acid transport system ATP-binding protein